jgi:BirA family biotin operon repressor/biotin-[acetyl-CoA-carboxylase] ligase
MSFDLVRLTSETFIDRVDHQPVVTSTNDRARQLAAEVVAGETLLVLADEQTAGRGRGSNRWWTGPASLAFSLLLDTRSLGIERRYTALISLAAAAALVDTLRERIAEQRPGIHWPNDVFVGPRKLAGILVESLADGRHIVGLGLNVNDPATAAPPELRGHITSLVDLTSGECDRTELLVTYLANLRPALGQLADSPHELARYADRLCLQHGERLTIDSAGRQFTGICTGIADDGALVLDTPTGPERIYSGVLVK